MKTACASAILVMSGEICSSVTSGDVATLDASAAADDTKPSEMGGGSAGVGVGLGDGTGLGDGVGVALGVAVDTDEGGSIFAM